MCVTTFLEEKFLIHRKRILLITNNGGGVNSGFASRVKLMAKTIHKNIGEVTLIRFYPMFRSDGSWTKDEFARIVTVVEIPVFPMSRIAIFRELSFFFANIIIHFYSVIKGIDCIQAESHEAAHVVLKCRLSATSVVVDYHGAVTEEAAFSIDKPEGNVNKTWHSKAEQNSLKADAHFFVSEKLKNYFEKKYNHFSWKNSHIIPINVDEEFFNQKNRSSMRQNMHLRDNDILFVYSGGCQKYQCINEMLEIFFILRREIENIKLLILTMDIGLFKSAIDKDYYNNLDEIIFRAAKNKREVSDYLSAADYAFLLRKNVVLNRVACPTKFGEYLASGVPVISTPWAGHAPEIIKKRDVGLVIDFDEDYLTKIKKYLEKGRLDPVQIQEVAREEVHWMKSEDTIINFYSKFLS